MVLSTAPTAAAAAGLIGAPAVATPRVKYDCLSEADKRIYRYAYDIRLKHCLHVHVTQSLTCTDFVALVE
jgi:hypothetical protein